MQNDQSMHTKSYLVLLNSESLNIQLARTCLSFCKTTICADGSANRLYDSLTVSGDISMLVPDFIIGDLDSVRDDVLDTYRGLGVQVIRDADQDNNDLDKCLAYIQSLTDKSSDSLSSDNTVVILGAYGGRFDQEAAALHALYRWTPLLGRIVLLGEHASTFLLGPGVLHRIQYCASQTCNNSDNINLVEGPTCGLIPLANRVHSVTTTGLTWNLCEEPLELGVRISSSNRVAQDVTEVTVRTSDPILWTWANRII